MTTKHSIHKFILLIFIAASAAAPLSPLRASDLKPYKVGYNSWIGSIAFFVANEKGFFKDEGLDVKPVSFSSPGDTLVPLMAGDLDAALSTADTVITVLDKAPGQLKVVYMTDTHRRRHLGSVQSVAAGEGPRQSRSDRQRYRAHQHECG
jgi:NitT/TauT family transport system substrate-binding protein